MSQTATYLILLKSAQIRGNCNTSQPSINLRKLLVQDYEAKTLLLDRCHFHMPQSLCPTRRGDPRLESLGKQQHDLALAQLSVPQRDSADSHDVHCLRHALWPLQDKASQLLRTTQRIAHRFLFPCVLRLSPAEAQYSHVLQLPVIPTY